MKAYDKYDENIGMTSKCGWSGGSRSLKMAPIDISYTTH